MKKVETRKLFFGKYLYKITLMNVLGSIFRGKNFTYAGEILDSLQQDYENGQPLGVPTDGDAGTTNTGGGGGGGTNAPGLSPNSSTGGNGGSGIVIIRYKFQ